MPNWKRVIVSGSSAHLNNITASGNLYVEDSSGLYTDKVRRYSDSDNTTKIILNDEVLKLYAGHSSNEVLNLSGGANGIISGSSTSTGSFGNVRGSRVLSGAGTVGAPGISFTTDQDTGFYGVNINNMGCSVGGTLIFQMGTSGLMMVNQAKVSFDSDATNTYIASNTETPEDLEIHADQDILLKPDGNIIFDNNISGSATSTGSFGSLVVADKVQGSLEILETGDSPALKVVNSTATAEGILINNTTDGGNSNTRYFLKTERYNGGIPFIITNGGRVGVSTDSPSYTADFHTGEDQFRVYNSAASIGLFVSPQSLNQSTSNGSNYDFTIKTTNTGTFGGNGGYIYFKPQNTDLLTLLPNKISGSASSTGSFGHLMQDGKDLPPLFTTGSSIYIGENAGVADDGSDNQNIGIGKNVLDGTTTGQKNIAIGNDSMTDNVTGNYNVAVGFETLKQSTGGNNVAIGYNVLEFNTGDNNIAMGYGAMGGYSQAGDNNIAIGYGALDENISGDLNIAIGYMSLDNNTTGEDNLAIGDYALANTKTRNRNVALGSEALRYIGDGGNGYNMTAVGWNAGKSHAAGNLVTASYGVFLGHTTKASADNSVNEIVIGSQLTGKGSNTAVIGDAGITDIYLSSDVGATVHTGNVSGSAPSTGSFGHLVIAKDAHIGEDVLADGDVVAYNSSDIRLKDNIQVIQGSLDKIGDIRGVEFDWNDKSPGWARERGHDVGVIAQEVEKVLPEVVVKRKSGYLGVDYKRLIPLLVESIKELKQEVENLKKKVN